LGEPFFALGKETLPQIDRWPDAIRQAGAVVNRLAVKYRAAVVPYPRLFDEASKRAPADHWIWDGLHPTCAGHQLMAHEWARTYRENFGPPGELPRTA
jgi:lysophospholipase L1-like esterase